MGYGLVSTERLSWFPNYPGVQKYVSDETLEQYALEFNPSKSIEIFEGLGFTRGSDGIFVTPNGTKLSYDFLCLSVTPEILAFANDMKNIGVDMTPRAFSWGPYWSMHGGLDYDLAYYWASIPAISTPYTWYRQFVTANWREPGIDVPEGRNRERYRNPEYDALVQEVTLLADDDPRAVEIWDELLQIFFRDMITIPIEWHMWTIVLNNKYWTNYPTPYNGSNPYATPKIGVAKFLPMMFNIESTTLGKILPEDLIPTVIDDEPVIIVDVPEDLEEAVAAVLQDVATVQESVSTVQESVEDTQTDVSELVTNLDTLSGKVGGQSTTLLAVMGLSIISILLSLVQFFKKQ
jgi:hypothetical protein